MATVVPSIHYTEPSRWFMEQLLNLEPDTQNGGIYAFKPGYHSSRINNEQNWVGNYSIRLIPDQQGPATKAAAYDWTFPSAQAGNYDLIDKYSSRLLAAGQANDPRTDTWREFYGQADEDTAVEGWDFYYNAARTSDASHLWHIHLSELRQFLDDLNSKKAMLSVLRGETLEQWLISQAAGGADMVIVQQGAGQYLFWPQGVGLVYFNINGEQSSMLQKGGVKVVQYAGDLALLGKPATAAPPATGVAEHTHVPGEVVVDG